MESFQPEQNVSPLNPAEIVLRLHSQKRASYNKSVDILQQLVITR